MSLIVFLMSPVHTIESVLVVRFNRKIYLAAGITAYVCGIALFILNGITLVTWAFYIHDSKQYVVAQGFLMLILSSFLVLLGGREAYHIAQFEE
ncbi:hypothetical protein PoB_007367900 [Plakobranchus ocellatus]|uniref:Uncharacterized protein n=1 Tax=Plakobranchus ocellatus TaxID=259542 RepID=A0AAV4DT47_9GAST|nr:hypothetical protein PoB_007367900 [Plakobranchus ocellatus]